MAATTNKTEAQVAFGSKVQHEEWHCRLVEENKDGKVTKRIDKLDLLRKPKITVEQAETLNRGILEGNNTYFSMYFKEGSDTPAGVKLL